MTGGIDHDLLKEIPGGPDLIAWFDGRVPSFHDAEVVELLLDRIESRCRLKIHGFRITPDLDNEGYFVSVKHVVVTLQLTHVTDLKLEDYNHQNVIDGLGLVRKPNGRILVTLEPCYGLWGEIEAVSLEISLEPGAPPNSIYIARTAGAS